MENPVPARLRGQGFRRVPWLPSFLFRAKQAKGTAPINDTRSRARDPQGTGTPAGYEVDAASGPS